MPSDCCPSSRAMKLLLFSLMLWYCHETVSSIQEFHWWVQQKGWVLNSLNWEKGLATSININESDFKVKNISFKNTNILTLFLLLYLIVFNMY